ncbi:MAG: cache domain-containing protein [Gemmataceae bacterium]|nr:cache domain-containing protein [Gemmataceae bacterium]
MFYNQKVPGISCSAPVLNSKGKLRGVLSIDFDLNALSDFVAGLSVSKHSTVFLFTANQGLLAHPSKHFQAATDRKGDDKLPTLADIGHPLVDAFRQNLNEGLVVPPSGGSNAKPA